MKKRDIQGQSKPTSEPLFVTSSLLSGSGAKPVNPPVASVAVVTPPASDPLITLPVSLPTPTSTPKTVAPTANSPLTQSQINSHAFKAIQDAFYNGHLSEEDVLERMRHRDSQGASLIHRIAQSGTATEVMSMIQLLAETHKSQACLQLMYTKENDDLLLPIHLLEENPNLQLPICTEEARKRILTNYEKYTVSEVSTRVDGPISWPMMLARYAAWADKTQMLTTLQQAWLAYVHVRRTIQYSATDPSFNYRPELNEAIKYTSMMRAVSGALCNAMPKSDGIHQAAHLWYIRDLTATVEQFKAANCEEYAFMVIRELLKLHCSLLMEVVYLSPGDHVVVLVGRTPDSDLDDWRTWGAQALIIDAWANRIYPATEIPKYFCDYAYYKQLNMIVPFDPEIHDCYVSLTYSSAEFAEYHAVIAPSAKNGNSEAQVSTYEADAAEYMKSLHQQYHGCVSNFFHQQVPVDNRIQSLSITPQGEHFEVTLKREKDPASTDISITRVHFMSCGLSQLYAEALKNKKKAVITYLNQHPDILDDFPKNDLVHNIILDALRFGIVSKATNDVHSYITYEKFIFYFKAYLYQLKKSHGLLVLNYLNTGAKSPYTGIEVIANGFQLIKADHGVDLLSLDDFHLYVNQIKQAKGVSQHTTKKHKI